MPGAAPRECARVSPGGQGSLLLGRPRASGRTETSSLAQQTLVTTSSRPDSRPPVTHTPLRHGHFPLSLPACVSHALSCLIRGCTLRPTQRCCASRPECRFPRGSQGPGAASQRPRPARAVGRAVGSGPRDPGWQACLPPARGPGGSGPWKRGLPFLTHTQEPSEQAATCHGLESFYMRLLRSSGNPRLLMSGRLLLSHCELRSQLKPVLVIRALVIFTRETLGTGSVKPEPLPKRVEDVGLGTRNRHGACSGEARRRPPGPRACPTPASSKSRPGRRNPSPRSE